MKHIFLNNQPFSISVNEKNSLFHESNNDNTTPEVHQLIDEPESVATLLLEINRNTKSVHKSAIRNEHLPNGHISEASYEVSVENDVEEEQNQNLSEYMQDRNELVDHEHERYAHRYEFLTTKLLCFQTVSF